MSNFHILYRQGESVSNYGSLPTIEEAQEHADREGYAGAAIFHVGDPGAVGGGRGCVDSIRVPGRGWVPFEDQYGLAHWWERVPATVRAELAADADAALSGAALDACVHAGVPATSDAWWVATEDGPTGFYIPEPVRVFVRAVSA